MKRGDEAAGCIMQPFFVTNCIKTGLILLAWLSCTAECIIVPSGKVGPIIPYRSTPRPTPDPSQIREPAPVVEYSQDNPEPPPLNPNYIPQSYKTLSALSGNSIFYIPLKIKNIHEFQGNSFSYVSQQPQQPTTQSDNQPKYVSWKGTYYSPPIQSNNDVNYNDQPDIKIPVPVQEVDYTFPKKNRYYQSIKPIIVPPLPPVSQDYYHYNYNNGKYQQNYNNNNNYNYKNKYEDPLEDKNADQYRYDSQQQNFPKKYNRNVDGSTTKYYYYVKHDYRTDYNNDNSKNNNNNNNNNGINNKSQR